MLVDIAISLKKDKNYDILSPEKKFEFVKSKFEECWIDVLSGFEII